MLSLAYLPASCSPLRSFSTPDASYLTIGRPVLTIPRNMSHLGEKWRFGGEFGTG